MLPGASWKDGNTLGLNDGLILESIRKPAVSLGRFSGF
jgi:hypothetical protein